MLSSPLPQGESAAITGAAFAARALRVPCFQLRLRSDVFVAGSSRSRCAT
jgi:hypothetical protein